MEIYKSTESLQKAINRWRSENPEKKLGFVPTMGALHDGHMSLIAKARQNCGIVVASVFVNPTQFNDPKDLERYPRTEEADIALLTEHGCQIMFLPNVKEMYPPNEPEYSIELNGLDKVMEGKYRQGHFEGVCNIVEKLFRIVTPDEAFFGIKDFQQVAIIRHMVRSKNLGVNIIACPIHRNSGGLALSSRNELLSAQEKENARILNWTLKLGKQLVSDGKPPDLVKENMQALFKLGDLKLEYLEIVDNITLQEVSEIKPGISACIAAYCGKVRLIDNIQLN